MSRLRKSSIAGCLFLALWFASVAAIFVLIFVTAAYGLQNESIRPLLWYWLVWIIILIGSSVVLAIMESIDRSEEEAKERKPYGSPVDKVTSASGSAEVAESDEESAGQDRS